MSGDPNFDEYVDVLRVRLRDADALSPSDLHSIRTLMADYARTVPDVWYVEAFEELQAQGHLFDGSALVGGDAVARLSADGRLYLRSSESEYDA